MKLFAILAGIGILLMAGFWLMYSGFRGMVVTPSSPGVEILTFLSGLVCLIAGLIAGVYLLRPESEYES